MSPEIVSRGSQASSESTAVEEEAHYDVEAHHAENEDWVREDRQTRLNKRKTEEQQQHNGDPVIRQPSKVEPKKLTHKKRPWRLRITSYEDIVTEEYAGRGTEENPFVVSWLESVHDVENPLTYSQLAKWSYLTLSAVATFAVALASSLYTGGAESVIAHFQCSQEVFTLGLSLFVLGFAVGPLLWAPASEMYGRRPVMIVSYAFFTLWNGVAAASPNMASLIIFRFLAGAFGSSPLVNSGGVISDMFHAKQRAVATAIFAAMPFLGGFLGVVDGNGWRWIQLLLMGFSAFVTILCFFFMPETYAPTLLRKRAATLSRCTDQVYRAPMDVKKLLDVRDLLKTSLSRPWKLLFKEPIVFLISLYMACVYGTLYMFFGAFPVVYQEGRGWSPGIGGLAFIPILIGMLLGTAYIIFYENPRYNKHTAKVGGRAQPEARLPASLVGGPCLVVGLAFFAGTDGPNIHWIVSMIASSFFGFGMMLIFISLMNYLIDAYLIYAASVLAANSVLRSIFGAVFPLFTDQMYHNLGIHWATAVPAAICLVLIPCPVLFYKYGARIRKSCKYAAEADALLQKMMAKRSDPSEEEKAKEGAQNESKKADV